MPPSAYSVQWWEGVLCVRFSPGTVLDLKLICDALTAEGTADPEARTNDVWDLRGCRISPSLDSQSMQQFVDAVRATGIAGQRLRTAVLVDSDELYSYGRRYEILARGLPYQVAIVRDESAALAWCAPPPELLSAAE